MKQKRGFTLIELLIVIAIIGIVAAIAIPNLLTALQKGKQKATMGDMKSIGTAIESYMTDLYMAPTDADVIGELQTVLSPFYIKVLPTLDGWGTLFQYELGDVTSADRDAYSITSYGRDTADSSPDPNDSPYVVTSMAGFENDIIYSNGNFTYAPKVK